MSDTTLTFEIPFDNEGFVKLKCQYCGELFKLKPSDYKDDSVLAIRCPSCGLVGDDYLTDKATELAQNVLDNYANNLIYSQFKKLEKNTKNSFIKINAGKQPTRKSEEPLNPGIDNLLKVMFSCCSREAKIEANLKLSGCHCPFCGVMSYEFE